MRILNSLSPNVAIPKRFLTMRYLIFCFVVVVLSLAKSCSAVDTEEHCLSELLRRHANRRCKRRVRLCRQQLQTFENLARMQQQDQSTSKREYDWGRNKFQDALLIFDSCLLLTTGLVGLGTVATLTVWLVSYIWTFFKLKWGVASIVR